MQAESRLKISQLLKRKIKTFRFVHYIHYVKLNTSLSCSLFILIRIENELMQVKEIQPLCNND